MSIIKNYILFVLLFIGLVPYLVSAQLTGSSRLSDFLHSFQNLLALVVPTIFGLATVYFLWGVTNFILNAGNEKTRRDGINKMIWGIVALTVFASIFGIIRLMRHLVNI